MADVRQPSVAAIASASAIISFMMGYFFGQARSIGLFGGEQSSQAHQRAGELHQDNESDSSESDNELDAAELKDFPGNEECKLVLVTRTDLGMVSFLHE